MDPQASREPCLSHPHNEILDFWLSTGLVGLAAFLWLLAVFWVQCVRLYPACGALLLGTMGAVVAMLIHGLVDNSYFLPDLALIFWLLCGFVSYRSLSGRRVGGSLAPSTTTPGMP